MLWKVIEIACMYKSCCKFTCKYYILHKSHVHKYKNTEDRNFYCDGECASMRTVIAKNRVQHLGKEESGFRKPWMR